MDLVCCKCTECDAVLGRVANVWTQIGKKYMMNDSSATDTAAFCVATSGNIRHGDAGTLVGGCQLQDAHCPKCQASLGQKCHASPRNHVLADGQIIFRMTSIMLRVAGDMRRKIEPNIGRVLKLKGPATAAEADKSWYQVPNDNDAASSHLDWVRLQHDVDTQRHDIARIGASGMQLVANVEAAMGRVEGQMRQMGESIETVRTDSNAQREEMRAMQSEVSDLRWDSQNKAVVSRLDQQLQTTDRVVTELQQALDKSKTEVGALRKEMGLLREQTDLLREQMTTMEKGLVKAKADLVEAKAESAGLKDDLAGLKDDLRQVTDVAHQSLSTCEEYTSQVSTLRRQVQQLRAELAEERQERQERVQQQEAAPSSVSSHELDVLATTISKIGNRASQVESLQMEFELFKSRVQRIEARVNTSCPPPARSCVSMESSGVSQGASQDVSRRQERAQRNKRAAASSDDDYDTLGLESTPFKRVTVSPSHMASSHVASAQSTSLDIFPLSSEADGARRRTAASGVNAKTAWSSGRKGKG